jgi:hypothetical protein
MRASCIGIDLGTSADHTALVLAEVEVGKIIVPRVEQLPLRVRYDVITRRIEEWATEHEVARLLVDATGVGAPIVSELQRRLGGRVIGVIFTSGSRQQQIGEGLWTVPKAALVNTLLALVRVGRLEISAVGDGRDALRQELATFMVRQGRRTACYEASNGSHDDMVCALMLAVAGVAGTATKIASVKGAPCRRRFHP